MLNPLLQAQNHSPSFFFTSPLNPIIYPITIPKPRYTRSQSCLSRRREATLRALQVRCEAANEEAARSAVQAATATKSPAKVKVVVTVQSTVGTGLEKETIAGYAHKASQHCDKVKYEGEFSVPSTFGEVGAVLVENEHHKEMYLHDIVLTTAGDDATSLTIDCRSWVHSKFDNPEKRVFFTSKSYLPSQTPPGLERLRKKELANMRGDGTGERKPFERIYDYDTYNDLGDPDKGQDMARPVLGDSKEFPYPRRCRTGRPRTKKDPLSEERSSSVYVPRDEAFSEVKGLTFSAKAFKSVLHAVVPSIETAIIDTKLGFPYFTAIDSLFNEGVKLPKQEGLSFFRTVIPRVIKAFEDSTDNVLLFEAPEMIDRDKFAWFRDEEFSRQTLAGLNPFSIQLVTEFPFVSKLDPEVYGPAKSAITAELIEREILGVMTVEEALKKRRLFVLDYHDLLLPYVHKVRGLEDTTLYASRTVFFLTSDETLMPIAIELTRPASPTKPQWQQVFGRSWDATGAWLWRLAKAHLSAMHPIYRLLHPHFRYTMEINAMARESLINAGGVIESCFSPGKYSAELSAAAYGKLWRFDMEALPADLIRRGMAVEDPTAEHGLRLTINDYPFANDGLLIWSSIKEWVRDYVNRYYPTAADVTADHELQAWWEDVRTKGHADKKDEPWWPTVASPSELTQVLTTIIWVTSGHHAAVNFGQYHFGGYFPNRPTVARKNMPVEDMGGTSHEDFARFLRKPEAALLECFPSQIQATKVMSVLDVLSTHSPDEEYLGQEPEPAWAADAVVNAAFERFNGRMREIEGIIDARNADPKLKNRCGAGIVPYELLRPSSKPGVTGMGVPNSISI
ncbi:Linoleate 13S-lipoxygenase 2-1, chloroplastic [Ananas comosus]|uniref:linoleate 13S-lipoxygenase n=1 Tax=Ananas comosus TaxID=4615 RepID=A0A199VJ75_ANACO|nr:Linoleate 13S-lipoxygenase 2-1, chloroplastic [Ananas comosus]